MSFLCWVLQSWRQHSRCPLAHVQCLIHQHPQVLSRAALDWFIPRPGLMPGVAPARCNTLHLVLLNAMRSPWAHFLNLSTSLWRPAWADSSRKKLTFPVCSVVLWLHKSEIFIQASLWASKYTYYFWLSAEVRVHCSVCMWEGGRGEICVCFFRLLMCLKFKGVVAYLHKSMMWSLTPERSESLAWVKLLF